MLSSYFRSASEDRLLSRHEHVSTEVNPRPPTTTWWGDTEKREKKQNEEYETREIFLVTPQSNEEAAPGLVT